MKEKKFITYVFIIIIFGFFLMYPIMFLGIHFGFIKPTFSNFYVVEKETGNTLEKLNTKFTNLKNNINNKLSNYLFLYSEVNGLYPNFKNSLNFYGQTQPLGTNTDGEYIFKKNGFYILQSHRNDNYIEENLNKNISFYNELSKITDLYIYLPSRYEFQDFNNTFTFRDMSKIKKEFQERLNPNIKFAELKVQNEIEYQKLFYKTDHHWNSHGALKGYVDISQMLGIKSQSLNVIDTDVEYHGSIGKMVADAKTFDYFTYIESDITNDILVEKSSAPKNFKPLTIQKNKPLYYDQYVGFYNGLYSEVIYNYNNGNENLLILGDSYSWQIDYIIASHFNKTYVLNPKYLNKINIQEYLKQNNITKTLILMETQTTLFDNYNYNYVEKLGGK